MTASDIAYNAGPAPGLVAPARLLACRRRQGHQERAHRRARSAASPASRTIPPGTDAGTQWRHRSFQRRDRAEGGGRRAAAPGGAARLCDGHRRVQRRRARPSARRGAPPSASTSRPLTLVQVSALIDPQAKVEIEGEAILP